MLYRLKTTNEVVTQGELRRRNSNMSLPSTFDTATLELLGVEQVIDNGPMPVSVLQECVSVGVEPTAEGVLVVKYVVRDKFSDITTTDENGQIIIVKTKAEQEAEALEDEAKAKTEQLMKQYTQAVEDLLNSKAKERGYDNILSASSYAGVDNPFRKESEAFIVWRASVWATCYDILSKVTSGESEAPTQEDLIKQLPELSV